MTTEKIEKIKSRLSNIQIMNTDKVNLWLVFKKLKKATTVDSSVLSKEDEKNLESLLRLCGLSYEFIRDDMRRVYCVANNSDEAKKLQSLLLNFKFSDKKIHHQLGDLFSFPKESVKVFAAYADEIEREDFTHLISGIEFHKKYNHLYWEPYVRYFVRRGKEIEDSQKAKLWADEIRKELPELASEFEKEISTMEFK